MKKQLLTFATAILSITAFAQNYSGGTGISANPYLIANKTDLKYLSEHSSDWGFSFKQIANINFTTADFSTGGDFENGGLGFSPIGMFFPTKFTGNYDGDNFTIDSLYINRPTQDNIGLFGATGSNCIIKNIGITNGNIVGHSFVGTLVGDCSAVIDSCYATGVVSGDNSIGGLIGYNTGSGAITNCYAIANVSGINGTIGGMVGFMDVGIITNCYASGAVSSSYDVVGGFIGQAYPLSSITNCYATGTVSGYSFTGGFIGKVDQDAIITNCYATGSVNANNTVGGLAGENNGKLINCHAIGNVICTVEAAGGLVGYNGNDSIINCYATGNVSGGLDLGGLVGFSSNGTIINCHATGFVSNGSDYVGGLAGEIHGNLINCYYTGSVSATNGSVGGLVGLNYGTIKSCYANSSTYGSDFVGGLVGDNRGIINNSYSKGSVSAVYDPVGGLVGQLYTSAEITNCYAAVQVSGTGYVGGLVGFKSAGAVGVSNSFWNSDIFPTDNSGGGATGINTSTMQNQNTFTTATWDFVGEMLNGTNDYWTMNGCGFSNNGYPVLSWQTLQISGSGTANNPYLITNKNDLKILSENSCLWDKKFMQTANISFTASDFTNGGDFYNSGLGFSPIGNASTLFSGTYDGSGFTIDSLYINRPLNDQVGLFGRVNDTIQNIELTNCNIKGKAFVGGLVGSNRGTIINSGATGLVEGNDQVIGGLVGDNNYASISNSYASVTVNGANPGAVGGLVGFNFNGTINNCYATGNVTSQQLVGGLVGYNSNGTVNKSYSKGLVVGTTSFGGLIGQNYNNVGIISNCYWDTLTSGQTISAGGIGSSSLLMKTKNTYTSSGWDFIGEATNGTADIWKMNCATNNGYPVLSWQTLNTVVPLNNTTNITGLTITANATGVTYQWIDCNNANAAIVGETNQSFTATGSGNYAVVVTNGACSDTSACVNINTVDLKSFTKNTGVSIYPNPSNAEFTIDGLTLNTTIEIYNAIGEVMISVTVTNTKTKIDLSNKANGVYFIKTNNGYTHKLVKQD